MVKAVIPTMRRQKSGHSSNVSSLAGLVPFPFWGYYNASKFAVEGLTESLRLEVKPFGIRVSMIEPPGRSKSRSVRSRSPFRCRSTLCGEIGRSNLYGCSRKRFPAPRRLRGRFFHRTRRRLRMRGAMTGGLARNATRHTPSSIV
jgi:NAD(P)-dependent dehydrogenase (short-subunit alcohol dehydrogenase family)